MTRLSVLAALLSVASSCIGAEDWGINYDEAKAGGYSLEDPLTFADGRRVSREDWPARRAEILALFSREMFGQPPPEPTCVRGDLVDEKVSVGGFAVRRQYRMTFLPDGSGPSVNWICFLPRHAKKPVPVVLFLNAHGNHELVADPDIPVTKARIPYVKGSYMDASTRGVMQDPDQSTIFPVGTILARGYAVMSACYCEVSPDPTFDEKDSRFCQDAYAYTGVFELWPKRDPARMDDVSSMGAWAWALSRGLDLAAKMSEIDIRRSVVTGFSRYAKAALLAAARDERFAVCVPIQTGGGGCPLLKRNFGENAYVLNLAFRHWFCRAFSKYARNERRMPFDQHLLLSCIAPRGLLVTGFDDRWYDTKGEYLAVKAASPVWTLLGEDGMPDVPWPDDYDESAIGGNLGYVRRGERHGMSAYEWKWMLDFADGVFAKSALAESGR